MFGILITFDVHVRVFFASGGDRLVVDVVANIRFKFQFHSCFYTCCMKLTENIYICNLTVLLWIKLMQNIRFNDLWCNDYWDKQIISFEIGVSIQFFSTTSVMKFICIVMLNVLSVTDEKNMNIVYFRSCHLMFRGINISFKRVFNFTHIKVIQKYTQTTTKCINPINKYSKV